MAGIKYVGVTKRYDHTVVDRMDLVAEEGEFVVLVGPSGCGKTTSLRLLAGLESVSEGRIYIGDRDVTDIHPKDRNVAMVFQDYALYPHMTVSENMSLGLKIKGLAKTEIQEKVASAAKTLELESFMDKRPGQLSGGQKQRVAMGRAIVKSPEVYLFDEPLSNLDAKLRSQLRVEITRLHRRMKKTVLYVTHDQVEAMTLGDRIAVLNEGRIQQIGAPMELYRRPVNRFVAGFIGTPQMNFLDASLEEEEGRLLIRTALFSAPVPDEVRKKLPPASKSVVLGCRPHDIRYAPGRREEEGVLAAQADMVEPLGSESFLHCVKDGVKFIASAGSEDDPPSGHTVSLRLDPGRFHYFHPETGESLLKG